MGRPLALRRSSRLTRLLNTLFQTMAVSLAALPEKSLSSTVLCGALLPVNNNPAFTEKAELATVTIIGDQGTIVGHAAARAYNARGAYIVFSEVTDAAAELSISIGDNKAEEKLGKVYQVIDSKDGPVKPDFTNQFETVFSSIDMKNSFGQLVDKIMDDTLGHARMDTEKNFTVDLFDDGSIGETWQSLGGFIVLDKNLFKQITVNRFELLGLDNEESEEKAVTICEDNLLDILDFDAEISNYDRETHLTALLETPGVIGKMLIRCGQVVGYGFALNKRIIQCYGEDDEIVRKILATLAESLTEPEISLCIRVDGNNVTDELAKHAISEVRIERRHTRCLVAGVKWSKIACPGLGLHLF